MLSASSSLWGIGDAVTAPSLSDAELAWVARDRRGDVAEAAPKCAAYVAWRRTFGGLGGDRAALLDAAMDLFATSNAPRFRRFEADPEVTMEHDERSDWSSRPHGGAATHTSVGGASAAHHSAGATA